MSRDWFAEDTKRAYDFEAQPAPKAAPANLPRRVNQNVTARQRQAASALVYEKGWRGAFQQIDDNIRLFAAGATGGFVDRAAARVNSLVNWSPYEKELAAEQARTDAARARNSAKPTVFGHELQLAPSEIVGGIVSPLNKVGAATKGVKAAVVIGGRDAFIAGAGYSKSAEWDGMLSDGLHAIPWGLAGGAIFGAGAKGVKVAAIKLRPKKPVAPDVAPAPPTPKPKAGVAEDVPAPVKAAEPEPGALLVANELIEAPEEALAKAKVRIAKMTDEEAEAFASRVEKAEIDGDLLDDPHYRSLLHVDITSSDVDADKFLRAVNAFEDTTEEVLERVASTKVKTAQVDRDVAKDLEGGLTDEKLAGLATRSTQTVRDARTAIIIKAKAAIDAAKAHIDYLAAKKAGAVDAADAFKERLGRALYVYAHGRAIRSNQARSLQIGQEDIDLLGSLDEGVWQVDQVQLKQDVAAALGHMDTGDLTNLIARLKTGADSDEVLGTLLDPKKAEAYSNWRKASGTFEAFMKSNSLTVATGLTNAVSNVLHDAFRNGLARRLAAARLARDGKALEALGVQMELKAANAVYLRSHLVGLRAMLDRIKYDAWDAVEHIAGVGFGSGKVRAKASASKTALAAQGNFTTKVRENSSLNRSARLGVSDIDGFNAEMDSLAASGAFGRVWSAAQRAGAVALNTADSLGTAAGKLFTGAIDDWGSSFVAFKEKHALAARSAVREAMERGLAPEDIPSFVEKRTAEKVAIPDDTMWERYINELLHDGELSGDVADWATRRKAVSVEAQRVMFQDGPQTTVGKTTSAALEAIDGHGVILPYIRTPTRLLERGLVDYTPWGKAAEANRKLIAAGGPQAELVKAQMAIGGTSIAIGFLLGSLGIAQVTNGDWDNSKNLEGTRPLRLQFGDFHVEFGRLDPFATVLGLGAMFGQAGKDGFTDFEQYQDYRQATQAGFTTLASGFKDAVLSKSYLQGLSRAIDSLLNVDDGRAASFAGSTAGSVGQRLIPLSGQQRQLNDTLSGYQRDAVGFTENIYKGIIGLGLGLPIRRNALGDPVESQFLGLDVGVVNDTVDEVGKRLKDLGIPLSDVKKTDPAGFRLSAQQLDRLRELRGHEATDKEGRTLREALLDLLDSQEFADMGSKEARKDMVAEAIRSFNKPARELLAEEDPTYSASRDFHTTFKDYLKAGDSLTTAQDTAAAGALDEFGAEPAF